MWRMDSTNVFQSSSRLQSGHGPRSTCFTVLGNASGTASFAFAGCPLNHRERHFGWATIEQPWQPSRSFPSSISRQMLQLASFRTGFFGERNCDKRERRSHIAALSSSEDGQSVGVAARGRIRTFFIVSGEKLRSPSVLLSADSQSAASAAGFAGCDGDQLRPQWRRVAARCAHSDGAACAEQGIASESVPPLARQSRPRVTNLGGALIAAGLRTTTVDHNRPTTVARS